jgi:hypothetical protein
MVEETLKNDPQEMKIARDGSWLCKVFQSNSLDVKEKQYIIRDMIKQFKIKKAEKNGQSH